MNVTKMRHQLKRDHGDRFMRITLVELREYFGRPVRVGDPRVSVTSGILRGATYRTTDHRVQVWIDYGFTDWLPLNTPAWVEL